MTDFRSVEKWIVDIYPGFGINHIPEDSLKVFSCAPMSPPMCCRSRWAPPTCEWAASYSATGSIPIAPPTLRTPARPPARPPARRKPPRRCRKKPPRRCSTSPCPDTKLKSCCSSSELPLRKKKTNQKNKNSLRVQSSEAGGFHRATWSYGLQDS